jgi:hypothetical protein
MHDPLLHQAERSAKCDIEMVQGHGYSGYENQCLQDAIVLAALSSTEIFFVDKTASTTPGIVPSVARSSIIYTREGKETHR